MHYSRGYTWQLVWGWWFFFFIFFFFSSVFKVRALCFERDTDACLFMFCRIAGGQKKKITYHPVLPAHFCFFVAFKETLACSRHVQSPRLHWGGKRLLTPGTPPPCIQAVRFQLGCLSSDVPSLPSEAVVCEAARSGTSCHILPVIFFCKNFFLFVFSLCSC